MDLKMLLDESFSSDKCLYKNTTLKLGKNYYRISYELVDQYLKVTSVRKTRPQPKNIQAQLTRKMLKHSVFGAKSGKLSELPYFQQNMSDRYESVHTIYSKDESTQAEEIIPIKSQANKLVQVQLPPTLRIISFGTQTEVVQLVDQKLQTHKTEMISNAQQTVVQSLTQSTQTFSQAMHTFMQTDETELYSISTQTSNCGILVCKKTETVSQDTRAWMTQTDDIEKPAIDKDRKMTTLMISEVGELLTKQQQLLEANSMMIMKMKSFPFLRPSQQYNNISNILRMKKEWNKGLKELDKTYKEYLSMSPFPSEQLMNPELKKNAFRYHYPKLLDASTQTDEKLLCSKAKRKCFWKRKSHDK